MAWAFLPAFLRRRFGIDEVVTTLLLNPVAVLLLQGLLNGPWRNPETGFPDSETFGAGYELPSLFGTRVHAGLLIGLVLVAVTAVVLLATPLGVRLRAAGQSPAAARVLRRAGRRCCSGAARWSPGRSPGSAAASQVMGVQHQLTGSLAAGYGYTGVVVATLGGLSALGVLAVALLLGDVQVGAQNASITLQLPSQMGGVLTSVLLLTVVSALSVRHYRLVWRTPQVPSRGRGLSRGLPDHRGARRDLTIATPLVFGALGALLGERTGVLNLGIEGTLYAGAFVGFLVASRTDSLALATLAAVVAGRAGRCADGAADGDAGGQPARRRHRHHAAAGRRLRLHQPAAVRRRRAGRSRRSSPAVRRRRRSSRSTR